MKPALSLTLALLVVSASAAQAMHKGKPHAVPKRSALTHHHPSHHPHHHCHGMASGTAHHHCGTHTGGPAGGLH